MLISIPVENASKYVTDSGMVTFSLNASGKVTALRIFNTTKPQDSNINGSSLFERFYRPGSSRTSNTGGQGIDLSVAKQITILHNGIISAKQMDVGIQFEVILPNRIKSKRSAAKWPEM